MTGPVLALELAYWQRTVLGVVVLLALLPLLAILTSLASGRTILRVRRATTSGGAGPAGVLQPPADLLKALQKEDVVPAPATPAADVALFVGAGAVLAAASVIPAGSFAVTADPGGGLVVAALALVALPLCSAAAAWARMDELGAVAAAATGRRVLSVLPAVLLSVVAVGVQAGTFSAASVVRAQACGALFGWTGLAEPYLLVQPLGFAVTTAAFGVLLGVGGGGRLTDPVRGWSGLRLVAWRGLFVAGWVVAAALVTTEYLGGFALPGITTGLSIAVLGAPLVVVKTVAVAVAGLWLASALVTSTERLVRWLVPLAALQLFVTTMGRSLVG